MISKRVRFLLASLFLSAQIGILWWARHYNVVGWDLVGPAEGARLYSEEGLLGAAAQFHYKSRHFGCCFSANGSFLIGLIPGILDYYVPWLLWGHLVTLLLSLAFGALLAFSVRCSATALIVALSTSPALISHMMISGVWITGLFPHIAVLALVLRPERKRSKWIDSLANLVGMLVIYQLAFHCYELGKTAGLTLVFASLSIAAVSAHRRILWLCGGCLSMFGHFYLNSTGITGQWGIPILEVAKNSPRYLSIFAEKFFLSGDFDLPILFMVGLLALSVRHRFRFFIGLCLVAHLTAFLFLAVPGTINLKSRRFLAVLLYSLVAFGLASKHMKGRPALRRFMFCCLLFGQAWAGYVIVRFAAKPHSTLALPFTNGQGDYLANPDVMAIANEVAERVRRGERHAFVYGYETRAENTTDPAGLPERLLLMLGPRAFSDHIRFVSSGECTYSCVPRSPPSRLREAIVEIGVEFLHVPFEPNCARTPAMPLVKRMLDWHGVRYVDAPALFQSFDTLRITEILGRSRETGQAATAPNGRSSPRPRLCLLSFPTDLDPAPEHLAGSDKAKLMFPLNMYDGFFEYGSRSHASRLSPGNRLVLTGEIESEKPFRNVLFQIRADRGLSIHVNGEKVRVERDERSECTLGEAVLATGTNRMTIHDTGFSTSNWITLLTRYENGEIPDWTCR